MLCHSRGNSIKGVYSQIPIQSPFHLSFLETIQYPSKFLSVKMFSRMHLVYLSLLAVSSATSDVPGIPTSLTVTSALNFTSGTVCACTQLYDTYPGKLLLTTSANYTAETESYWDIRADLHPACIFQPDTADEVADAIKILSSNDVQFAIRGGGHMNVCTITSCNYLYF